MESDRLSMGESRKRKSPPGEASPASNTEELMGAQIPLNLLEPLSLNILDREILGAAHSPKTPGEKGGLGDILKRKASPNKSPVSTYQTDHPKIKHRSQFSGPNGASVRGIGETVERRMRNAMSTQKSFEEQNIILRTPEMSREAVPISQLTENQKNRALAFRRSKFDRRNISALVVRTARDLGATDLRTLDENTSIGIAALAKMFVCDLVESARSISNKNSDALSAISPEDYLEAYACISKECKIKGFDSESSSKAVSDKAWSKEFEDYI